MYWVLVWRGIHCLTYRICFLNSAFCWKDKVARAGIWRQLGRSSNPILLLMGCVMLNILISISEHNYSFPPMGVIYFFVGLSWRSVNTATWYLEHSQGSININLLMPSFKSFCVVWQERGRRRRERARETETPKTSHVVSAEPSRFLGKAIKSKKHLSPQAVSMATGSSLLFADVKFGKGKY